MIPPFEKLRKFLKLEINRKYDNRAVFGGFPLFANTWRTEAQTYAVDSEVINFIYSQLAAYGELSTEGRAKAVENILTYLVEPAKDVSEAPVVSKQEEIPESSPAESLSEAKGRATPPQPVRTTTEKPVRQLPIKPVKGEAQLGIYAPITYISMIGPKNAELYKKLGISTILDLLYYFPRRYVDFSKLEPINRLHYGDTVTIMATVMNTANRVARGGKLKLLEAIVSDGTGSLRLTWFNQPWIESHLRPGTQIAASGKLDIYLGRLMMSNPEWEPLDQEHLHTNRIVPVYSLTAGLSNKMLRKVMNTTVSFWASRVDEFLPESVLQDAKLMDLQQAIQQAHFPDSQETLTLAKRRLGFDEIFLLQLGVVRQKKNLQLAEGKKFPSDDTFIDQLTSHLPYSLTQAQQRVLGELRSDIDSGRALNRLIQGDVGSGKTVIAALAIAIVTNAGSQAAYMAPTSILAEQQYQTILRLLTTGENPILQPSEVRLLIGDTSNSDKEDIRKGLSEGSIKIIVGTHALLEAPIEFQDLQFVVIDEQHRFGVEQRAILRSKGTNPHLLVMTATPIPRSLALTLYGDLDVSVLDEMPAGRQPIETFLIHPLDRERVYRLIDSQIKKGFQTFIICPLVEQGDNDENKAAVEEHQRLQKEIFPNRRLGLLHGRMKPEEKDQVMSDFRDKKYDILVSTSVIEVGVDIPNATIMVIEGANHFGLAQLHQFRGRVGRGTEKSFCLLIPEKEDDLENERLQVMTETNDGFVLAERDLQQRGPGDFLGTRQAGFMDLRMAQITDLSLIEEARKQAQNLFEIDPDLTMTEHQALLKMVNRFWRSGEGDIS